MATLRDIKRHIIGVTNTQQITKAMKMVAAARLRRAQENVINARPYSRKIYEVLNNLLLAELNFVNPFFDEREVQKAAIIIVTSDRGMCGSFNMNVIRRAEDFINDELTELNKAGNVDLYCVGKKGYDYFAKRDYKVNNSFVGAFAGLKFEVAPQIMNCVKSKFLVGDYDKVYIVYNEFKSVMQQKLNLEQLLPIKNELVNAVKTNVEYIYEPGRAEIISALIPRALNAKIWKVLLESYAAELGARMTAMDMATENAKEIIRSLKITYNKARQAAITTEISEIVTGANALKEN
ncbi:MAG: ATP synthase F1 subunit gamma [bacterium]